MWPERATPAVAPPDGWRRGESRGCDLNQQRARQQQRLALPQHGELIKLRPERGQLLGFDDEELTAKFMRGERGDVFVAERIVAAQMDKRGITFASSA